MRISSIIESQDLSVSAFGQPQQLGRLACVGLGQTPEPMQHRAYVLRLRQEFAPLPIRPWHSIQPLLHDLGVQAVAARLAAESDTRPALSPLAEREHRALGEGEDRL
jgi:hypothetical protein